MNKMIITPKVRSFICVNAHPVGCYSAVKEQIAYVTGNKPLLGAKKVLIIGGSTGYGLASRIVATFACGAQTISVALEREPGTRTASAGWYNNASFELLAQQQQYYAKSINGDAFANDTKQRTVELIRRDLGKIDLLIYSIAAPRRLNPSTGVVHNSVLRPIGSKFVGKSLDILTQAVKEIELLPASDAEIADTVAVMGGDDWRLWLELLAKENLLATGITTVAYSYLGPELTQAIYSNGTIGRAKEHLANTAKQLQQQLHRNYQGTAVIAINKAIVTQASAAIPMVPLYLAILYKVMKAKHLHETCVQQIYRLFKDYLSHPTQDKVDEQGQIRIDNLEMSPEVQQEVAAVFAKIDSTNVSDYADIQGYLDDFYALFGFGVPGVDYNVAVDPAVVGPQHGAWL
jgi:enoyl-[acyl-carrier protein] reductase/trans-2-enoyl-CoA reductase (NAD+)